MLLLLLRYLYYCRNYSKYQVRVFPPLDPPSGMASTNAHRARALHAHVLGHPPRATY